MLPSKLSLPVRISPQPDETTCGPTCLDALYRYWGEEAALSDTINRTHRMAEGGTFGVFLACDALKKGYQATLYTYNLTVFDPTWFTSGVDIRERLSRQLEAKNDKNLALLTAGYLEFLHLGGKIRFTDLSRGLIRGVLRRNLPILAGVSSTYLYRSAREYGPADVADDIRGKPAGHFILMAGYDRKRHSILVADPYARHPYGKSLEYWISIDRVLGAVLLGILTHDANLLILQPRRSS